MEFFLGSILGNSLSQIISNNALQEGKILANESADEAQRMQTEYLARQEALMTRQEKMQGRGLDESVSVPDVEDVITGLMGGGSSTDIEALLKALGQGNDKNFLA